MLVTVTVSLPDLAVSEKEKETERETVTSAVTVRPPKGISPGGRNDMVR